jgi:hypothetical protein
VKLGAAKMVAYSLSAGGRSASVSRLRMYRRREPDSDQRHNYDRSSSYLARRDPFSWRPPTPIRIHAPGRCDLQLIRRDRLDCPGLPQ